MASIPCWMCGKPSNSFIRAAATIPDPAVKNFSLGWHQWENVDRQLGKEIRFIAYGDDGCAAESLCRKQCCVRICSSGNTHIESNPHGVLGQCAIQFLRRSENPLCSIHVQSAMPCVVDSTRGE